MKTPPAGGAAWSPLLSKRRDVKRTRRITLIVDYAIERSVASPNLHHRGERGKRPALDSTRAMQQTHPVVGTQERTIFQGSGAIQLHHLSAA